MRFDRVSLGKFGSGPNLVAASGGVGGMGFFGVFCVGGGGFGRQVWGSGGGEYIGVVGVWILFGIIWVDVEVEEVRVS